MASRFLTGLLAGCWDVLGLNVSSWSFFVSFVRRVGLDVPRNHCDHLVGVFVGAPCLYVVFSISIYAF